MVPILVPYFGVYFAKGRSARMDDRATSRSTCILVATVTCQFHCSAVSANSGPSRNSKNSIFSDQYHRTSHKKN